MKKSAPFILLYFLISVAIAQSGNEKWSIKDNSLCRFNPSLWVLFLAAYIE